MKRLNLNETWVLCLKMWKWVIKEFEAGNPKNVDDLKEEWCEKNGFATVEIKYHCFFCEYDRRGENECDFCPAKKIDKMFDCKGCSKYHYFDYPRKFYKTIFQLNKLRLKKR